MSEDRIDDEKCVRTETIPFGTVATITIPAGYLLHRKGRLVRVAKSPEEIDRLKRIQREIQDEEIVLHGSQEHIDALRESTEHHERILSDLSNRHGDVFSELESVFTRRHKLEEEKSHLAEHAIETNSSFDKYGFNAHLRTHDSHSPRSRSREDSMSSISVAKEQTVRSMKLFSRPIVRQYFHKGLLWRGSGLQEVASYELFIDLLFVGLIGLAGDGAAEDANLTSLLVFVLEFLMGWRIWSEVTLWVGWFDAEDVIRRVAVLFTILGLLGFTTNIANFRETSFVPCICFYLASRMVAIIHYFWFAYLLRIIRWVMIIYGVLAILSWPLWIGAMFVDSFNPRFALLYPAIILDLGASFVVPVALKISEKSKSLGVFMKKHIEFIPALNIEHRTERTGAFISLVFGYSVLSLFFQNRAQMPMNAFYGKAALGLVQVFALNMLYFEIDLFNLRTHAIRRSIHTSFLWLFVHVTLALSYTLCGASLARLVRAHDSPNSPLSSLDPTSAKISEERLSNGQRWFYCAGLGIALLSIALISCTHQYVSLHNKRGPLIRWGGLYCERLSRLSSCFWALRRRWTH